MKELQAIVRALTPEPGAAGSVLATLVTVAGSSYRRPGARLLLTPGGLRLGSISGGCLEEDVLARARRVASSGCAELVTYDTTSENDLIWGVGLGCHGVVQVLLEKLPPSPKWAVVLARNFLSRRPTSLAVVWRSANPTLLGTRLTSDEVTQASLPDSGNGRAAMPAPLETSAEGIFCETISPPIPFVIFGAGDDAQPLARFAKELGWHVTVADPRPDLATIQRFPSADVIVLGPATELIARVAPAADTVAVVMTHHYVHDVPLLRDLLPRTFRYVGLLGPKQRAERIIADLGRDGLILTPEQQSRLHAPIGLDIGADTPEEVALSIIAEIRAVLAGRDARPLRERQKPIHEVFAPQKPISAEPVEIVRTRSEALGGATSSSPDAHQRAPSGDEDVAAPSDRTSPASGGQASRDRSQGK